MSAPVKPSMRNLAASAQSFITFVNEGLSDGSAPNVPDTVRTQLTEYAETLQGLIDGARQARADANEAQGNILSVHKEWQKEHAPELAGTLKAAGQFLDANKRALGDISVGKGPEHNIIRAGKLAADFKGLGRAESVAGPQRDSGAYWEQPFMGI